ncbi:hypothetical protein [Propioniferax innocua]|uniref:Uncharacterized protein n=1 Tax=Propioniferax innocua TaxID=1753 RepID=A0A542ZSG9_9ACTN|nr:hypothetical protein [Propioniferax innocua]TQL63288.1 hypothetical protein FB460_1090 [Propioniferax innocua]
MKKILATTFAGGVLLAGLGTTADAADGISVDTSPYDPNGSISITFPGCEGAELYASDIYFGHTEPGPATLLVSNYLHPSEPFDFDALEVTGEEGIFITARCEFADGTTTELEPINVYPEGSRFLDEDPSDDPSSTPSAESSETPSAESSETPSAESSETPSADDDADSGTGSPDEGSKGLPKTGV